MEGTFREWLNERVGPGRPVSTRELARRVAGQDETTGDPDNARRTIRRVARGDVRASQPTRDAIQRALGDFSAPSVGDEDADQQLTREMVIDRLRSLRRDTFMLERALTSGAIL